LADWLVWHLIVRSVALTEKIVRHRQNPSYKSHWLRSQLVNSKVIRYVAAGSSLGNWL